MTRKRKIEFLQKEGIKIDFHYREGKNYRRLVIDSIEDKYYNITSEDQVLAGQLIDELFEEI